MNNNLLNILSNSNKDIDNQKLMDYLSGQLPEKEKQEVEQWMAENDFSDEAMEGLQQFKQHQMQETWCNLTYVCDIMDHARATNDHTVLISCILLIQVRAASNVTKELVFDTSSG